MLVARHIQRRCTAPSLLLRRQQPLAFCTAAPLTEHPPPPQQLQPVVAPITTWSSLVVGEIVALASHPAAERLSVCHVDIGDREHPLQIICGAPNVRTGAKVPVATIGTRLAIKDPASGDVKLVKIKKSKLRGEVSQGMICSEAELGLALESDGILILEDDAPVGSLVQDWGSVASRLLIKAEATALETPNDASHGLPK